MTRGECSKPQQQPRPSSPDWPALVAVALTTALHFVLQAGGPNPAFILGAGLFWTAFVAVRARQDAGAFRRWGFRADNLVRASAIPAALFVVVAAGFGIYANQHGTLRFPAHATLLLLLYPSWGLVQQFLVLALVVGNLQRLPALGRRPLLLVVGGAALFAAVHAPDVWLVAATFVLELALVPLYLKDRNLWPLGVVHGWLGALFYLWILGRDMWAENFG